MDLLEPSPGQKTLENKEKNVFVNFSHFAKTTDVFTKILGFIKSAPKERRRRRAEKRLSKRVILESPFLLCPLKVCS